MNERLSDVGVEKEDGWWVTDDGDSGQMTVDGDSGVEKEDEGWLSDVYVCTMWFDSNQVPSSLVHICIRPSVVGREQRDASHRLHSQVTPLLDPVVARDEHRRDMCSLSPVNAREHHRVCSRQGDSYWWEFYSTGNGTKSCWIGLWLHMSTGVKLCSRRGLLAAHKRTV